MNEIDRRERDITVLTAAAHFMAHLYMLVFPSLALVLREPFGLELSEVLALGFWMYLLYGLGALPSGILTDLANPRRMLIICLLGMGASSVAAGIVSGPAGLRIALAGVGLSASIYHPAGMALITRGIRRRGSALGTNGLWGNLGVVVAPFLAGLLVVTMGWRATYIALGVPSLVAGVLAFRVRVDGEVDGGGGGQASTGRRKQAFYFALLCIAMMFGGIAYRGQTLVLPAWFSERVTLLTSLFEGGDGLPQLGTKTLAATAFTSLAYLAGALGQVAGGRLADRYDLRRLYLVFHGVGLPLLWALGALTEVPLLLCALAYAFFSFGMQPIENSLVAALTPPRLRSTGYGLKFILTFGVGSLAVPLTAAWQRDGGIGAVFPRLAISVGLLLFFAGWLAIASRNLKLRGDD